MPFDFNIVEAPPDLAADDPSDPQWHTFAKSQRGLRRASHERADVYARTVDGGVGIVGQSTQQSVGRMLRYVPMRTIGGSSTASFSPAACGGLSTRGTRRKRRG